VRATKIRRRIRMLPILEHFSHRYTLADDGEEQLSLIESCQSFCGSAYICARNALLRRINFNAV
jgi:hypothetical protein